MWLQLCQPRFNSVWALAVQDSNAACVWQSCAALRKRLKRNKTSQEHLQQFLHPSHDAKQL